MKPLLFLALANALLAQAPHPNRGVWPDALRSKAKPSPAPAKKRPASGPGRAGPPAPARTGNDRPTGIVRVSADPQPGYDSTERLYRSGGVGTEEWVAALKAAEAGRSPELTASAVGRMQVYFDQYPRDAASLGWRLADLYFRLDRNADAYALLAPLATEDAMDETLLRASVAAAQRGEVYPGQREYCVRSIVSGWADVKDRGYYLPQGGSSGAVLTLSLLATAADSDSHGDFPNMAFYARRVLRRDPGNPLACEMLADDATRNFRFAEAIALHALAARRAEGSFAKNVAFHLEENHQLLRRQNAGELRPPRPSP